MISAGIKTPPNKVKTFKVPGTVKSVKITNNAVSVKYGKTPTWGKAGYSYGKTGYSKASWSKKK